MDMVKLLLVTLLPAVALAVWLESSLENTE